MSVSTKKSVSLRDESTVSTAGMSDEDIEFPILKLRVGAPKLDIQHLDLGAGTVLSRYYAVIKAIKPHWLKYSSLGVAYELNQIIATDVTNDILEILPSLVGNVFVKCEVVNGELFIVDLSAGEVHGAAVNNLCYQVNNWNDTNGAAFNVWSDTINNPLSQNHGTAPDVALTPFSLYSNTPNDSSRIVIIELEASHRSVKQMRERYLTYFNNNPRLFSVVGVKFFGVAASPCRRAVAVQWVREGDVVYVHAMRDFGVFSLTDDVRDDFEEALPNALPPIAATAWQQDGVRCAPTFPGADPAAVPVTEADMAAHEVGVMNYMRGQASYSSSNMFILEPSVSFDGGALTKVLHNLPPNFPALPDLTLNLGVMTYRACRIAPAL